MRGEEEQYNDYATAWPAPAPSMGSIMIYQRPDHAQTDKAGPTTQFCNGTNFNGTVPFLVAHVHNACAICSTPMGGTLIRGGAPVNMVHRHGGTLAAAIHLKAATPATDNPL